MRSDKSIHDPLGGTRGITSIVGMVTSQNGSRSVRLRLMRCFRLLNLLQSRIGYRTNYLARQFQVSRRTIFRDIQFLEEIGIPVLFDSRKDGYVLSDHFNPSASKLANDEMAALLLAGHIFSLSCGGAISHSLNQAVSKLLVQMPTSFRDDMGNLLNSIHIASPATSWLGGSQSAVMEVLSAICRKQQVRIVYKPKTGAGKPPVHTKVTPNRLITSDGRWYLVGRSTWHRKTYRFDVEHIQSAESIENEEDADTRHSTVPCVFDDKGLQ